MNPVLISWIVVVIAAIVSICHLMQAKQAALQKLLTQYVTERLEWARKKKKSQKIVQESATAVKAGQAALPNSNESESQVGSQV